MRNILSTVFMYGQIIYELPVWITSSVMALVAYACSTQWIGHNIIWTSGTTRWFGVTAIFGILAVAKPVYMYFDRLDREFHAATR